MVSNHLEACSLSGMFHVRSEWEISRSFAPVTYGANTARSPNVHAPGNTDPGPLSADASALIGRIAQRVMSYKDARTVFASTEATNFGPSQRQLNHQKVEQFETLRKPNTWRRETSSAASLPSRGSSGAGVPSRARRRTG